MRKAAKTLGIMTMNITLADSEVVFVVYAIYAALALLNVTWLAVCLKWSAKAPSKLT